MSAFGILGAGIKSLSKHDKSPTDINSVTSNRSVALSTNPVIDFWLASSIEVISGILWIEVMLALPNHGALCDDNGDGFSALMVEIIYLFMFADRIFGNCGNVEYV